MSASLVAQLVKNQPAVQETPVRFRVAKICWRRDRLPTPGLLGFPGGSAGKESLSQNDPLEKGIATPSSILAWRIPWTEEPDGLQVHEVAKSDTSEAT